MTLAHPFAVLLGLLGREAEEEIPICSQEPGGTGLFVDWCRADEAADLADRLVGRNVWFGVQPTARPDKGRGTSKSVTGLVALYCDIDFADSKTSGMGVDRADAMDVVGRLTEAIGAGPCAIVSTGHGLQPYWAIERCDQVDGALLLVRWKQVVKAICTDMGIKLDMGVYDLPRILRVPGTVNVKAEPVDTGLAVKSQAGPLLLEAVHSNINDWFARIGGTDSLAGRPDRESMRALMANPGARAGGDGLDRVFTDEQAADFLEENAWRPARETPWGGGQDYWKVIWQCAMVASHFVDMYDEQDLAERLRAAVLEGHGEEPDARDEYQIALGFAKGGDWLARRPSEREQLDPFSNARDEARIVEAQGGIKTRGMAPPEDDGATEYVVVDGDGVIVSSSYDTPTPADPRADRGVATAQRETVSEAGATQPCTVEDAGTFDAEGRPVLKAPTVIEGARRLTLQSAATIGIESSDWLWKSGTEHWIPLGGLVLLGGREGVGKSTWTARLIAQVTTGRMEGEYLGKPKGVIMCATEDAWAQTIVPRLAAAGADLNKVWRVDAQVNETTLGSVHLPHDIPAMAKAIAAAQVALVVLDPLMGTIDGKLDSHKDQDVRIALEPISRLAADASVTVLGLIHQNKSQSGDLLTRLMGSRAFSAVARTVLVCAETDEEGMEVEGEGGLFDPEVKGARQFKFGQLKNNLAARVENSVRYEIEGKLAGKSVTTSKDVWSSRIKVISYKDPVGVEEAVTATEKAKASKAKEKAGVGDTVPVDPTLNPTKVEQAMQFIADLMANHPDGVSASSAVAAVEGAGFSAGTYTSARSRLGVGSIRDGKGWLWAYRT